MQTKTYADLFQLIQSLAGVRAFTFDERSDIGRFINRRYLQIYNESPNWVRYLVPSEQRYLNAMSMDVTFNLSGDDSSGSLVTKTFYYVGNYNNLPLYSTKDETDPVTVNNWMIYNGGFGGDYGAEWMLVRGSPNTRSYTNPSETTISSISSPDLGDYLYRTNNMGYLELGGAVTKKNYKPYPHVSENWLDSSNLDATNLAFSTRNLFVPFDEVSPYSSVQKNIIGDFVRIHRDEALVKNSSVEYDFYVDGDGSHPKNLADSEPKSVYVTYKKEFTPFSVEPTDAPTSTAVVPQEFFQYIAHASYADFLRMDGQHQKALLEEQAAEEFLNLQLERNDIISNNNNATTRFSTYVNRQSR